jgi:hypothetical protein
MPMCPGCGQGVNDASTPPLPRYNAATECLEHFHALSAIHINEADSSFIHQIAVDCYGAQHTGGPAKPITAAYSLIGLCLHLEHGLTGKQVQAAHMSLARRPKTWPLLPAPTARYSVFVDSILACDSAIARTERIEAWALSTWKVWREQHEWVRSVIQDHGLAA